VEFLGRVSDAELASMYARAAIFALPSSKEGFGIVYLEAWQWSLPVIGGSEGAAPEVIDHGVDGLIANEHDPQQLADHIERLLGSAELREKMGTAGNKKVSHRYSNDAARRNLSALLTRMGIDSKESVSS
jgi:phosphatidyl-myo-inositol dimannoside synthase